MSTAVESRDGFRKGFVLAMTIAYAVAFLAMISGFFTALLLAAILAGIVYPLYRRLVGALRGRCAPASLLTLLITMAAIIVPLILLLGLVAQQAVDVAAGVKPWIDRQIAAEALGESMLYEWIPFAEKLEPYREEITAKLAGLAGDMGGYLAGSLARLSQGTAMFFLNLFVMLYAMYFFLVNGPALLDKIMGYAPLSKADKKKMLDVGLSVSRATVKGTLVIGIIQGALGGLSFAVAGIQAAIFWGAVMAVLSVLPGIGAMLVWGPAVIYLLMSGQIVAGVLLFAWCAGAVGTVDNFLRPVLVGRDTQMPDLLILLSTLGGLALFGALGLVLGPILAALFLTVLSIYSRVFQEWLVPADQVSG